MGRTATLSTESHVAPSTQKSKNEITAAMTRSLYRDFIHIAKAQLKQSKTMAAKPQFPPNDPLQQVRDEFRRPILSDPSGSNTIESRYHYGINRFAFLRMNTTHYKPRARNQTTNENSGSADTGTERYIYKNGQRYALHSIQEGGTLRSNQRGYVISPYDGKNLDPQAVTRHRQNLKRAGFINNSHAKGMF